MERKSCVKENKKVVNKKRRHPELDSGSHLVSVLESGEIPNQVWNDKFIFNNDNNNAFTLIELLVVVLIIGILAAVALPQYQKAVLKSRYTQLLSMGHAIEQAAESYYLANNVWPRRFDELDIDIPGTGDSNYRTYQDYTCLLTNPAMSALDGVTCTYTVSQGILGYRFIRNDSFSRRCMASKNWELGNKICQNMTNKANKDSTYGPDNDLQNVYFF